MRRFGAAAALSILLLVAVAPPAAADLEGDLADVQVRIDRFRDQVDAAGGERTAQAERVLEIAARLEEVSADLAAARDRLDATDAEVAATESEVSALDAALGERSRRIEVLRSRIDGTATLARQRVVDLYMSGSREPAEAVFSSTDVSTALVGVAYAERVQQAADRDIADLEHLRRDENDQVSALATQQTELEQHAARLEDRRAQQELVTADVRSLQSTIEADLAEQHALLDEIDAEIAFLETEVAALAAEEANLKALIRQEQSGDGDSPGILRWPVVGPVVSPFGLRLHPIYGDWRMHTGMDIDAACGVPIVASAGGRVFLSGWNGGYGLTVMIDHGGGMATLYAHQSVVGAVYGQQVSAGDVIGWIGTTGVSTGCHLHFEVRVNGSPVDPAPYL